VFTNLAKGPQTNYGVRIPTRKSEELKPMILAYLFLFDNDITYGARRFSKGHRIQSTRWSLQTSNNHSPSSEPQLQSANCFKHSRYVLASVNPSALAIIKFAQPLAMALRDSERSDGGANNSITRTHITSIPPVEYFTM